MPRRIQHQALFGRKDQLVLPIEYLHEQVGVPLEFDQRSGELFATEPDLVATVFIGGAVTQQLVAKEIFVVGPYFEMRQWRSGIKIADSAGDRICECVVCHGRKPLSASGAVLPFCVKAVRGCSKSAPRIVLCRSGRPMSSSERITAFDSTILNTATDGRWLTA